MKSGDTPKLDWSKEIKDEIQKAKTIEIDHVKTPDGSLREVNSLEMFFTLVLRSHDVVYKSLDIKTDGNKDANSDLERKFKALKKKSKRISAIQNEVSGEILKVMGHKKKLEDLQKTSTELDKLLKEINTLNDLSSTNLEYEIKKIITNILNDDSKWNVLFNSVLACDLAIDLYSSLEAIKNTIKI